MVQEVFHLTFLAAVEFISAIGTRNACRRKSTVWTAVKTLPNDAIKAKNRKKAKKKQEKKNWLPVLLGSPPPFLSPFQSLFGSALVPHAFLF
jgi:hypothetical protein